MSSEYPEIDWSSFLNMTDNATWLPEMIDFENFLEGFGDYNNGPSEFLVMNDHKENLIPWQDDLNLLWCYKCNDGKCNGDPRSSDPSKKDISFQCEKGQNICYYSLTVSQSCKYKYIYIDHSPMFQVRKLLNLFDLAIPSLVHLRA